MIGKFDGNRKGSYSEHSMKRLYTTMKRGGHAMPKKIQFEWELPDALVDELAQDPTDVADTIKGRCFRSVDLLSLASV